MRVDACRSCGARPLEVFLDLGRTPLANSLPLPGDPAAAEERFALEVARCAQCSLVQILEGVPPERLFGEYLYFSSFSAAMVEHMKQLAERLIESEKLGQQSLVMEVASNDGYLLQSYVARGVPVLGVEPARNVARKAIEHGIPTEVAFFGAQTAARLRAERRPADVLHANNVIAHVEDINGFVAGIAQILSQTGVAVIETPWVRELVDQLEFDTIYHEHVFYHSLTALQQLFARHRLEVVGVERVAVHGGSLRVFVAHAGRRPIAAEVWRLLAEERELGLTGSGYYRGFSARVEALRDELRARLGELKRAGKRLAAYGASAKGATLLNTFGIGTETLDFVVDRNVYKQGRLMPGVRIPISAPERLLAEQPDYVLLLTWNFADEILAQQAEYRARGGRFIVPLPAPRVV